MTRSRVFSIFTPIFALVVLAFGLSEARADAERTAVVDALSQLQSTADTLARAAGASEDRAIRRKLAPRATELADELGDLYRRARRDAPYGALARDARSLGRDARSLVELADDAEDRGERKSLRSQASIIEQGIDTMAKAMEILAARKDDARKAPAKPTPMSAAAFDQLVRAIDGASFDDDKVNVVRHAAQSNWFLTSQVGKAMDRISFEDGKIDAAAAMWPRLVDPENSFAIFNKLSFDSSKDKLRKRVSK